MTDTTRFNDWEKRYYQIAQQEEALKYMYQWKDYLVPDLTYRKPFLVNAHEFTKRPSENGTLPIDSHTGELKLPNGPEPDLLSETSDEEPVMNNQDEDNETKESSALLTEAERLKR